MFKNLASIPAAIVISAFILPPTGQAQTTTLPDDRPIMLEEVIVTANRREENLQEVPMSVTAFSGDFFKETGTTNFSEIQNYTPNLQILTGGDSRSTSVRIRGIGSVGSNSGIDPSVGIFVDGVYQGRAGMTISDLFDIQQVEVLRGPQGTLYGKNTAAGAITIATKQPSLEFEAEVETVIANNERYELRGMVNVPFGDSGHAMRVTAFGVNQDHLYENTLTGDGVNDVNKYGTKTRFLFDFEDAGEYLITVDYSKEDTDCCAFNAIDYDGLSTLNSPLSPNPSTQVAQEIGPVTDPASDYPLGSDRMQFNSLLNNPLNTTITEIPDADPFDNNVWVNETPQNKVEVGGIALEANWEIPGDHSLVFIPAWRHYETDSSFDGDFSGFDAVIGTTDVQLDQYSGELRIASQAGETWEYQAGLYAYYSDMDSKGTFEMTPLLTTSIPDIVPGFGLYTFYPDGSTNVDDNTYKTTSYAVFGQTTWNISDKWTTTLGLRYTYEKKERIGSQITEGYDFSGSTDPCDNVFVDAPPIAGGCIEYDNSKEDSDVSPSFTVRYFPVDDLMTYALISRGFKSGGFDQRRVQEGENGEFDPETSTNYELGWKGTWLDRTLQVNGTFYYVDYDDFQSQTFDGSSLKVTNAGNMRSYGTELEIVYVAGENTTMGSSIGYNKAEYEDFDNGQCTVDESFDWYYGTMGAQDGSPGTPSRVSPLDPTSPLKWGNPPESTCLKDLGGESVENTPEWTTSSWIQYNRPVSDNLVTVTRVEHQYTNSYFLDQDQDKNLKNDAINVFNLRFALTNIENSWEAAIWGKNITDEKSYVLGIDIPTVGGYAGIVAPRRTYGLTLRYNYY